MFGTKKGDKMRRRDREITDAVKIEEVIKDCHCIRLGFCDNGIAYIVPLNFGYEKISDSYVFYFHGAKEGRKVELMKQNSKVGFEMDTNYKLQPNELAHECTAAFQSIIGVGEISFIAEKEEKIHALNMLMKHNTGKDNCDYPEAMINQTLIFSLKVTELACKEHL